MRSTFVTVRGEEFEVEYRDGGYDPTTNFYELEWNFVDPNAPNDLTQDEDDAIFLTLTKIAQTEYFDDDCI